MKLLCRIGWHDWGLWQPLHKKTYSNWDEKLQEYYKYKQTTVYSRTCKHCYLVTTRESQ